MNERKLSELQKEYRDFFLEKMNLYGVKSPAKLTKEKKSEFFTSIKQDWAIIKIAKSQTREVITRVAIKTTGKPQPKFQIKTPNDLTEKPQHAFQVKTPNESNEESQEPRPKLRQEQKNLISVYP